MNEEHEFLEMIITSIVSKPDEVKIERKVDDLGVLYTINVAEEDIAKIIGKQGNIAQAIRLLLKVVGYKYSVRAAMKIDIPNNK